MKIIIAEKPSVARDIARVLGCDGKKDGYINGSGYAVTWAFGHLVEMAAPEEIKSEWGGRWNMTYLPMIPDMWQFKVSRDGRKQFRIIKELFNARDTDEIICATDAGREGEHIFRLIYQESGCNRPAKRLWISSLTDEAIRQGFKMLKDIQEFDPLAAAAMSRAKADWLFGLNFTRAYTVHNEQLCTVGRVQTPTLALVVNREHEILNFVKSLYYELHAAIKEGFTARYVNAEGKCVIEDKKAANAILEGLKDPKTATVIDTESKQKKQSAPALFNLLNLQRATNKHFGLTGKQTLEIAQALYEKHKVITYPRTESCHVSTDMTATLDKSIKGCPDLYDSQKALALQRLADGLKLGKRYVDDAKLTDHHAIIPTGETIELARLNEREKQVYQLVCEQFLAIFLPACITEKTKIDLGLGDQVFRATGTVTLDRGWKSACLVKKVKKDADALPKLEKGAVVNIAAITLEEKETKPPARYNDDTLLAAMKSAGRFVDDEDIAALMKENGLGTAATRAEIVDRLIRSGYLERQKKVFVPTQKGIDLIDQVQDDLKSPELTGKWEQKLKRIEESGYDASDFDREIVAAVSELIPRVASTKKIERQINKLGRCPACNQGTVIEGKKGYDCDRYKEGCKFVIWKEIAKKKVSPAQARQLLETGQTDTITGFKSKVGKNFAAALKLDDGHKVVFHFADSDKPKEENHLGTCPVCKEGRLAEFFKGFACSSRDACKFVIWKEVAGKRLPERIIKQLVEKGRTELVRGFKSKKSGKRFEAYLVLKDAKVGMEFKQRGTPA